MNNEYIIVNKTTIEKRIEELENELISEFSTGRRLWVNSAIKNLKEVLSQSTPLIPQIENAFDAGVDSVIIKIADKENLTVGYSKGFTTRTVGELVELYPRIRNKYDYISKLDI
jgi:hypothetical protein